jgi:hypothetical protein
MKYSHIKTPRTMRDAFGEDTRLSVAQHKDPAWAWFAAAGLVVIAVLMTFWNP